MRLYVFGRLAESPVLCISPGTPRVTANVEVYDVPDKELPTQAHFAHWQREIIMAALGADTSLPHTFVIPDGNIYCFLKFSRENMFSCHACAKYVLQDGLFFSEGEH